MDNFIHTIKGILVFGELGELIYSKFYKDKFSKSEEEQKKFKKSLYEKISKFTTYEPEVLITNNQTCVFKLEKDLYFSIVGDEDDNELILAECLNTLIDSLNMLFGEKLEKRTLLENFDLLILTLDEILDDGVILEIEPSEVAQRVDKTEGLGINEDKDPLIQAVGNATKSITGTLKGVKSHFKAGYLFMKIDNDMFYEIMDMDSKKDEIPSFRRVKFGLNRIGTSSTKYLEISIVSGKSIEKILESAPILEELIFNVSGRVGRKSDSFYSSFYKQLTKKIDGENNSLKKIEFRTNFEERSRSVFFTGRFFVHNHGKFLCDLVKSAKEKVMFNISVCQHGTGVVQDDDLCILCKKSFCSCEYTEEFVLCRCSENERYICHTCSFKASDDIVCVECCEKYVYCDICAKQRLKCDKCKEDIFCKKCDSNHCRICRKWYCKKTCLEPWHYHFWICSTCKENL